MIRDEARFPAPSSAVFPFGVLCLSVDPLPDASADPGGRPQARDEDTNEPLWVVRVTDLDPEAARPGRSSEARVTIAAFVPPAMPERKPGGMPPFVSFEGLTVSPYVDAARCNGSSTRCRSRQAYRLRAVSMRPAPAPEAPGSTAGDEGGAPS